MVDPNQFRAVRGSSTFASNFQPVYQATDNSKNYARLLLIDFSKAQGTLTGPEPFIHMLSDFKTVATDVKFVDDSTLVDIRNKNTKSDRMQEAANEAASWSEENRLGINETKTKQIIVWLGNNNDIPPLEVNGKEIE